MTAAAITPFTLDIDQAQLDDLAERLSRTRWPQELPNVGWDYGMPVAYARELTDYWREGYDWREQEAELNAVPNFTTTIDGQRVHFINVRSPAADSTPLVLTHGWPGSLVEFLAMIGPLTDPTAFDADEGAPAFDVVIPSLPGFALSGPTTEPGWDVKRIARAWAELMARLGYDRYMAHGGDFGAHVSRELGLLKPQRLIGVHLTELPSAAPDPGEATDDEADQHSVAAGQRYQYELSGYMWVQSQRPQTLAFALADSPVGQLAWIAERFRDWTAGEVPDDTVDRDALLTNVMLYWLTDTAASSSRIYKENASSWGQDDRQATVPTAIATLPGNIAQPVRRLAELTENLVQWTALPEGGHFPGLEVPNLLTTDIRKFATALRDD